MIKQDSIVELCLREGAASTPSTPVALPSGPTKLCRSMSRDAGLDASAGAPLGELALLQRQHSLLQEELGRLRATEGRLRDSEKARALLEQQIKDMRSGSAAAAPPGESAGTAGSEQVSSNSKRPKPLPRLS